MSKSKFLILFVLVGFVVFTGRVLAEHGYIGLFMEAMQNLATWQVLLDLVIALSLVLIWMIKDAKEKGRNVVPYILLTLTMGSIGPLVYLLLSPAKRMGQALAQQG